MKRLEKKLDTLMVPGGPEDEVRAKTAVSITKNVSVDYVIVSQQVDGSFRIKLKEKGIPIEPLFRELMEIETNYPKLYDDSSLKDFKDGVFSEVRYVLQDFSKTMKDITPSEYQDWQLYKIFGYLKGASSKIVFEPCSSDSIENLFYTIGRTELLVNEGKIEKEKDEKVTLGISTSPLHYKIFEKVIFNTSARNLLTLVCG